MAKKANRTKGRKERAKAKATPSPAVVRAQDPGRTRRAIRLGVIFLLVALVAWALSGRSRPGQVWDPAHGHWHAADGSELPSVAIPAGQVWSEEHGHWHDASGSEVEAP